MDATGVLRASAEVQGGSLRQHRYDGDPSLGPQEEPQLLGAEQIPFSKEFAAAIHQESVAAVVNATASPPAESTGAAKIAARW